MVTPHLPHAACAQRSWSRLLLALLLGTVLSAAATEGVSPMQSQTWPTISSFVCQPETALVGQAVLCVIEADSTVRHFEFRFDEEDDIAGPVLQVGGLAVSFTFRTAGVRGISGIVCSDFKENLRHTDGMVDAGRDHRCDFRAEVVTVACGWTGSWSTNWSDMTLKQTGSTVIGDYAWDQRAISGTVTDNVMSGTWSEAPSRQPPDDAGDFAFTMADDCQSFTGTWRYGASGDMNDGWNGKRTWSES